MPVNPQTVQFTQATEQLGAALADVAHALGAYHRSLADESLPEELRFALVMQAAGRLLRLMGLRAKGDAPLSGGSEPGI